MITNWLECLDRAIEKEPSRQEWINATLAASEWPTCACGELCKTIPRTAFGMPKDYELSTQGNKFMHAVMGRRWKEAREIFLQIEYRTSVLLQNESTTTPNAG